MSSSLFRFGASYSFQDSDRRIIDSNALIADKIERLSAKMQEKAAADPAFGQDFVAGLNPADVEGLLSEEGDFSEDGFSEGLAIAADLSGEYPEEYSEEEDGEGGAVSNIIKAPRPMQAMMPSIDIEAKTEELLSSARQEAEQIVNSALEEAEQIKEGAREEGFEQGFEDGLAKAQEQLNEKLLELDRKEEQLMNDYNSLVDELEPKFVDSLIDVFEHVLHVKYSDDKAVIYHLIKDAVRKADGATGLIIHVSREDYGFVSMQKRDLLAGLISAEDTQIIEDATLAQNECFIETGSGIFDCSLETQLEGLKRQLRLLAYSKND